MVASRAGLRAGYEIRYMEMVKGGGMEGGRERGDGGRWQKGGKDRGRRVERGWRKRG